MYDFNEWDYLRYKRIEYWRDKIDNNSHCVYVFMNWRNAKKYVGMSSRMRKRYNRHLRMDPKHKSIFHRALDKWGADSFCLAIMRVDTREEAERREYELIEKFNTRDRSRGYNMIPGGVGNTFGENNPFYGRKHTEETKAIIKEKRKYQVHSEEQRRAASERMTGEGNPFYGKKHPPETRELIKKNRKQPVLTQSGRISIGTTTRNRNYVNYNGAIFWGFDLTQHKTGM